MKKLLSLTLALLMVFSLATVAMATTTSTTAPVVKVVTGENAPSETYTFTVTATEMSNTPASVTTQPTIPNVTITTGTTDTDEASGTLDLSNITEIGIYTYMIAETAGNTAGMSYDGTKYTLQVTGYYDTENNNAYTQAIAIFDAEDNKVENATFNNTYSANTLTVEKQVTGNLGDTTKPFSFTVSFENENAETISWINAISASANSITLEVGENNTYTFTLISGASATFSNIPSGISYTVTESDYSDDGYTTKIGTEETRTADGTMAGEDVSVTVVNDKDEPVDTGITLDSVPFILILSVCAAAVVLFVIKRRNTVEF